MTSLAAIQNRELIAHAIPPGILLFDRYRVGAKIAEGSVASVYRAEDEQTGFDVALKVFDPLRAKDPIARLRFEREFRILSALGHTGVARALRFERSGELDVLVLEYIDGESLEDRLAGKPLQVDDAVTLVRRIGDALTTCHRAGVIHRDLKPSNIVLHPTRGPVIVDFGVAWFSAAMTLTRTGAVVGSPRYVAPEMFTSRATDERVDVYSLGAILFEALTGCPLRKAQSVAELAQADRSPPPSASSLRSDVPEALDRIVERAVAVAPEDRYATAKEMTDALKRGHAGRARRLEAHLPCAACGTPVIVDLQICPGCGRSISWSLEPGSFAVQLLEVTRPAETAAWLRRRYGDALAVPRRALARRLDRPPAPLVVGVSHDCAVALASAAREVGCRAEVLRARRVLGAQLATPRASQEELGAALALHFGFTILAGALIAFAATPEALGLLCPALVSMIGFPVARWYVRRPLLQVPEETAGNGPDPALERIAGRLARLAGVRARALAATGVSRAAPLLIGDETFGPEDRRLALEALDEVLDAAREVDLHAAMLADVSREDVRQAVVKGEISTANVEEIGETSIAHDMAVCRALTACEAVSRALMLRNPPEKTALPVRNPARNHLAAPGGTPFARSSECHARVDGWPL